MDTNTDLSKNLAEWRKYVALRRKGGERHYARCLLFLSWANTQDELKITSWRDVRPTQVDNFLCDRLDPPPGLGWTPVTKGTAARDVLALRSWLEWNEENELTGPIRSRYLKGRVTGQTRVDKFALSDDQAEWLLQRARWVARGQRSLRHIEPGPRRRLKACTATDWPPGGFHLFCRFGLELGLRPRELFWLAWEDFGRAGDERLVLQVQGHSDGTVTINEVKPGANSRRRLVLPADLASELLAFRDQQKSAGEFRRFLFAVSRPDLHAGWQKPEIAFIFKGLKHELGDDRLKCNTLRKTCGHRLRRAGLDYFAIAQFLGHSPTTCMKYYVRDCQDEQAFDPATCKPVNLAMVE